MREPTAKDVVHGLSLFIWAVTAVITYITIDTLVRWRFFTEAGLELYRGTPIALAATYLLILVVIGGAIGWGLWHKRAWGRIGAIIFCWLIIADTIIFLFAHLLNVGLLLLLAVTAWVLWFLGRTNTKKLFLK